MLYTILNWLFKITTPLFFKQIVIKNIAAIPKDKPVVFLSNHQSAFMDAILIGAITGRKLHFMSRGEAFSSPFKKWIFRQFNMFPIYRPEITPDLVKENPTLLRQFRDMIKGDNALLIFPEGISHTYPKVLPIKTGAARIILSAYEKGTDFEVIPIGLNYEDPHSIRKSVTINIGKPLDLRSIGSAYIQQPKIAVQGLTRLIDLQLKKLSYHIENEKLHPVFNCLVEVSDYTEGINCEDNSFKRRKAVQHAVIYYSNHFPNWTAKFTKQCRKYSKKKKRLGIDEAMLSYIDSKESNPFLAASKFIIGWTLFFLYRLIHFPVISATNWVVKNKTPRSDFKGSLILALATLLGVTYYILLTITAIIFLDTIGGILLLPILILSNYGIVPIYDWLIQDRRIRKMKHLLESETRAISSLLKERKKIVQIISNTKRAYDALLNKVA